MADKTIGDYLNDVTSATIGEEGFLRELANITIDGLLASTIPFWTGVTSLGSSGYALSIAAALNTALFGASASALYHFDLAWARVAALIPTVIFGSKALSYAAEGLKVTLPYVSELLGSAAGALGSAGSYLAPVLPALTSTYAGLAVLGGFALYTGYHLGKGIVDLVTGKKTYEKEKAPKAAAAQPA
ncbi:hypothetical protein KY366_04785 [Candidatus Woesearchaeota archaeon]|nr:hypothetical protein [Candidatus Woesearchaeota archaeon]